MSAVARAGFAALVHAVWFGAAVSLQYWRSCLSLEEDPPSVGSARTVGTLSIVQSCIIL